MSPRLVVIPRETVRQDRLPFITVERTETQPHHGEQGADADDDAKRELERMWWWAGL
jgi:hypothetical protein